MQILQTRTAARFLLSIAISLVAILPSPQSVRAQKQGASNEPDSRTLVTICPAVRTRIEKEHRIRLSEENFRGEKRVHVYLFMSEQPLPYVLSLGWFNTREHTVAARPVKEKKERKEKRGKKDKSAKKVDLESVSKARELLNPTTPGNKSLVAVDELGLVLPFPGSSPQEKNYDKAAWNAVLGFDHLNRNDLNDAEKEFADAIKIAPINARFNNNLGAILAARGKYSEASPHFDRAVRENDSYAAAYANRALLSLAIGQPVLAFDDSLRAIKLDPGLIPARVAYGRSLLETGKLADALKVAQALKAEAPSEWQSMLLLADALLANCEFRESRATLARLSVLSPANVEVLLKLAHANDKLGDLDNAIKQARKATQVAPGDPRTHITLGRYLDANRDANAARLQFERAMDLKPEKSLRKVAMGGILRILIATDKLPDADELSKKWLKQYSDDAACHYNRAWIASQIEGDHMQECIDGYRKALELDPSLKSVHYNLGLVLVKAGKKQEALEELKSFVTASPNDSDSESARELIKKLEDNG